MEFTLEPQREFHMSWEAPVVHDLALPLLSAHIPSL